MTDMIIQSIGGIAAVYGFAGILGVPKKFLLWAGIDGGIGWFVYLLVGAMTHSELLGAFFGAAVISVGANVCARVFKTPVTMILIPANMTLVPGAGMYFISGGRAGGVLFSTDITDGRNDRDCHVYC